MKCRRHVLAEADRAALVATVVSAVRAGRLCALPTETVYGLLVRPQDAAAVARVRALKGRAAEHEFTWHCADAAAAQRLCPTDDPRARRLVARYWPGPLTLVLPGPRGGTLGVRVPAHDFTRAVLAELAEPVWLTSVNRTGEPPLCDPETIGREFGGGIDELIDDGPSPLGTASTVVRCTGPELEVLREGILSADEVLQAASATVVFVCTGNTCRSPLAEVLARQRLAKDLGIAPEAVLRRGLGFVSAGTATLEGMPASDGSRLVAGELQLDLEAHRSRPLTEELVGRSSRVYCLSESHLQAVLALVPAAAGRTELLRPDGLDIADPFGGELDAYRRARDQIASAVEARLPEWRALLGPGAGSAGRGRAP